MSIKGWFDGSYKRGPIMALDERVVRLENEYIRIRCFREMVRGDARSWEKCFQKQLLVWEKDRRTIMALDEKVSRLESEY